VERWWARHAAQCVAAGCADDLRYVVQDYLAEPMTLPVRAGRKFDLRLYILLTKESTHAGGGWKAFLYREGMVRLCAVPYTAAPALPCAADGDGTAEAGAGGSEDWRLAHLTNTSMYREVASDEDDPGADTADSGQKRLQEEAPSTEPLWGGSLEDAIGSGAAMEELWEQLTSIATATARALQQGWTDAGADTARADGQGSEREEISCGMFQVIGLDVMLDVDRQPWVLEVNSRPSLSGKEEAMKQRLLRATLRLLLPPAAAANAMDQKDEEGGEEESALVSLALE